MNYRKKALTEWSTVIRQIGECEMCERKGIKGEKQGWRNLDAHHLIPKGLSSEYATDLSNGMCLCKRCHQWEKVSPHQNLDAFEGWLERNRPGQYLWYDEHYPKDGEKIICGELTKVRVVRKTPNHRTNWKLEYETLKEIVDLS